MSTTIGTIGGTPIPLPVPFIDRPWLLTVHVPRADVTSLFGPPQFVEDIEGVGDGDFWTREFECGLRILVQYMHATDHAIVFADSPEIDHVLRHLPFGANVYDRIDAATLAQEVDWLRSHYPERATELDGLASHRVWRQGDDGNAFPVGEPTSERDARCHAAQLEARGHKQLYWVASS